ncbi:MAG: hypothetical protein ACLUUS_15115 [Bacteroides stercoris]
MKTSVKAKRRVSENGHSVHFRIAALYEKKKQTEEKAQWYGGRNINDRR